MCLVPKLAGVAAPPPLPTALDASVIGARAQQRTKQKKAGGYTGQTLLSGDLTAPPPSAMKTLLGG